MTVPTVTPEKRADLLLTDWYDGLNAILTPSAYIDLRNRIAAHIGQAEQAAEIRGAERMRERCVAEISSQAQRWRRRNVNLASIADDIATALAALPLEEGKE